MSRKSRADGTVQIWLQFGEKKPTGTHLSRLQDKLEQVVVEFGFKVYDSRLMVKEDKWSTEDDSA